MTMPILTPSSKHTKKTVVEHPPYNMDLSPYDYHMFGFLQEELGDYRFGNNTAMEKLM